MSAVSCEVDAAQDEDDRDEGDRGPESGSRGGSAQHGGVAGARLSRPVGGPAVRAVSLGSGARATRWSMYRRTTRSVDRPYTTLRWNPTELASSK